MASAILCSRCGAPLEVPGGATDARCAFCGATTRLAAPGQVTDPGAARELAVAIAHDIALFDDAFDPGTPPAAREAAQAKGRGLFQRRVAPPLHPIFEEVLATCGRKGPRATQT